MKTFKVAEIFLQKEQQLVEIPIQDGLVINWENEQRTWLLELFLDKEAEIRVRPFENEKEFTARIAITHRNNDPAMFSVSVRSFQQLEQGTSVLFDAKLQQMRNEYVKQLLETLLKQRLEGDELLEAFTEMLRNRPPVPEN